MNQPEIEFWGAICDGKGRRPNPRKVQQLEQWPEPIDQSALTSFLAFANYLREYLPTEWTQYERAFAPLRKKEGKKVAEFKRLWTETKVEVKTGGKVEKVGCSEAFAKMKQMLNHGAVMHHPDFAAAQDPHASGRPFELFVDASDYGWCGTLCQALRPHGPPKIISMIAKAFKDTELRWSAMERELYALWQAVVGHEKMIRGLLTFVYIDHKNNLFVHSMLDNRRIAKKVSNWALELQCFNIVRIWIRGEANILSDAPSRAPWENELAKHLVIPDDPVRKLIRDMYGESIADQDKKYYAVEANAPPWKEIDRNYEQRPDFGEWQSECYNDPPKSGRNTPTFGVQRLRTTEGDSSPELFQGEFGQAPVWPYENRDYEDFRDWLGGFDILEDASLGDYYPHFPVGVSNEPGPLRMAPLGVERERPSIELPVPVDRRHLPIRIVYMKSGQYAYWQIIWHDIVPFDDNVSRRNLSIPVKHFQNEEACRKAAFDYFDLRYAALLAPSPYGMGPTRKIRNKLYHGNRTQEFIVYPKLKNVARPKDNNLNVLTWNHVCETLLPAEHFCTNAKKNRPYGKYDGVVWQCKGHVPLTGDDYNRELQVVQQENVRRKGLMNVCIPTAPGTRLSRSRYPADVGTWEETPHTWVFHSQKPHSRLTDPTDAELSKHGPEVRTLSDRRITNITRPSAEVIDDNWREKSRLRFDLGYNFYADTTFIKAGSERAVPQFTAAGTTVPRRRFTSKRPNNPTAVPPPTSMVGGSPHFPTSPVGGEGAGTAEGELASSSRSDEPGAQEVVPATGPDFSNFISAAQGRSEAVTMEDFVDAEFLEDVDQNAAAAAQIEDRTEPVQRILGAVDNMVDSKALQEFAMFLGAKIIYDTQSKRFVVRVTDMPDRSLIADDGVGNAFPGVQVEAPGDVTPILVEDQGAEGKYENVITEAPTIRTAFDRPPADAAVLTNETVYRGAPHTVGPCARQGVRAKLIRKWVVIDEPSGKVLIDRDFGPAGPKEDYNWRIPVDPPRDIRVIVWYASADGTSQEAKDAPSEVPLHGSEHPEFEWLTEEERKKGHHYRSDSSPAGMVTELVDSEGRVLKERVASPCKTSL